MLRFKRKALGGIAVGVLDRLRARGEQHGALAAVGRLVERIPVALEQRQRAGPVAGGAAEFEHGAAGPAERRRGARRFLGESLRGHAIVAAPRLDEQAVQAKRLGIGAIGHGMEHALGRFAVTG